MTTKFKRAPAPRSADEFIDAASGAIAPPAPLVAAPDAGTAMAPSAPKVTASTTTPALPWEGRRDDKQTELFNLRFTEAEMAKLRFIAANTPDSMQAFVRKAILPIIEAKLAELLK